jgi:hypothetical protein
MTSLVLGDLIQESLTSSVNAPLAIFRPSGCLGKNTPGRNWPSQASQAFDQLNQLGPSIRFF